MGRRRDKSQRTTLSNRLDEKSVEDILVNLPVKSLLRFKCVSKSWQSLIQDPSFIEMYRSKPHPPQLLISQQCGNSIIIYSPKDVFKGGVAIHKVTVPWCMEIKKTPSSIDGLFCFIDPSMPSPVHTAATCIYNLATRQITPWAQTTLPLEFGPDIIRTPTYGFGFDPLTKNYKLVCVWSVFRYRSPDLDVELHHICEVLTVGRGENQWRKIDVVPPVGLYEPVGVYANGSIYWRNAGVCLPLPQDKELIVAFDVGTEKFRVIQIPDFIVGPPDILKDCKKRDEKFAITMIDGRMALIVRVELHVVKLWISDDSYMEEEKKKMTTNWSEETISLPSSFESGYPLVLNPVKGTDEIVIQSQIPSTEKDPRGFVSLYIYNRTTKRFRMIDITGIIPLLSYPYDYDVHIFHESPLPIY